MMTDERFSELMELCNMIMKRKSVSFVEAVRLACIFHNEGILVGSEKFEERIMNVKTLWE